jgi:hypothetical protein
MRRAPGIIDKITNKNDPAGTSPGWYTRIVRLPVYPYGSNSFQSNPNQEHIGQDGHGGCGASQGISELVHVGFEVRVAGAAILGDCVGGVAGVQAIGLFPGIGHSVTVGI